MEGYLWTVGAGKVVGTEEWGWDYDGKKYIIGYA